VRSPGTARPGASFKLLLLLAALSALGSLAIHMLVPALPAIARDLRSSDAEIQSALTVYLLALGCGQLIAGPASDIAGRRPVLLLGSILFAAGSAGAALADNVSLLIGARVVQALGGASGLVAARTILSDLTDPRDAAGRLAMLTTVVLVSPALSPVAGGLLTAQWGWRSIFILLTLLGLCALLAGIGMVRETSMQNRVRTRHLLPAYVRLFRNPRFTRYCVTSAAASCALYLFLAGSAFLLNSRYGLSPAEAGICYFLIASAAIAGTFCVAHLERGGGAVRPGAGAIIAGGALMLLLWGLGAASLAALIGPMLFVGFGGGIVVPACIAGAMHAEEGLAGTGASLAGAFQMSATGLLTTLAVYLHQGSVPSLGLGICAVGAVALLAAPRGRTA
jgi:DHA1 family bicyclomycin/chloramphenicol resistance-like MFS transporter